MGKLLTISEAAEIMRQSEVTVRKVIRLGLLPITKPGLRNFFIDEDDLNEYLKNRKFRYKDRDGG